MAEKQAQDDAEAPQPERRASRVRVHLIEPLELFGIQRPKRMTLVEYDAMKARLRDGLAHMTEDNLRGLCDLITRHAGGKDQNEWPAEVTVRKWALGLQPKPPRSNPYVQSLMRSEMGRRARAAGYHVELFMLAKKMGPPPQRYEVSKLQDEASQNRRDRSRIERHIQRGDEGPRDRQWLEWYCGQEAACLAIMDDQTEGADG